MKRYAEYKDSGIAWIGEIPTEWNLDKIKYKFSVVNGATPKSSEESYWNGEIMWITPADYKTDDIYIDSSRKTITEVGLNSCGTSIVPANSIIVSNRAPIGSIGITIKELCTNQGCKALVTKSNFCIKYAFYFLSVMSNPLNMLGRGTTFLELSSSDLANFTLPSPTHETQQAISDYLDRKTATIDTLITDKQKLVALLREKRQATISEAVTKGLDKNAPMKDSGIKWIGEIPQGWEIKRIKFVFKIVKRLYFNEDRYVLSITQKGIKIRDTDSNDGQLAQSYAGYQLVNIKDFAMNSMDLLTGFVDCSPYEGVTSPDYRVFRFIIGKEQSHAYYKHLFQMLYSDKIFYGFGQGVSHLGRWRLQTDTFKNFLIPVPSLEEQNQIAEYIVSQSQKIDFIIEAIQAQLEKLKEYRQSIISEAVTGKVAI